MVPFLPRSTFSRTLVLVVSSFLWNSPRLRDCVGTSSSDDTAPLSSMSFHIFLRMKDAGLPVSSRATQLLVRSDPVERLLLAAAGILPGNPFSRRASTPLEDAEMETWNFCT